MVKLLRANFARFLKTPEFVLCAAFSLAAGAFNILYSYLSESDRLPFTLETNLFRFAQIMLVISSVFVSLFFGTEYSVVRNRLIVGHTRFEIFTANLICAFTGVTVLYLLNLIPFAAIAPFMGATVGRLGVGRLLANAGLGLLAHLAGGGIFFMIATVVNRKSTGTAAAMLTAFLLIVLVNTKGTFGEVMKLLPAGQLEAIHRTADIRTAMPLVSLAVIAVTTAAGAVIFRFKDIK